MLSVLSHSADSLYNKWIKQKEKWFHTRKARTFKYSSRTGNRELFERLRTEHKNLYNECYASYMNDIEIGISVIRSDFLILLTTRSYPSSMQYNNSVGENSLTIWLKVSIMLILVTQILKMRPTHQMAVVSAEFGFACPM
jgi:hypothetical protein